MRALPNGDYALTAIYAMSPAGSLAGAGAVAWMPGFRAYTGTLTDTMPYVTYGHQAPAYPFVTGVESDRLLITWMGELRAQVFPMKIGRAHV